VRIFSNWVLALLTLLVVTTVLPAVAEFNSQQLIADPTNTISNYQLPITNYLEQGKQLYDAGRFAEAAQVWEMAAKAFEQQGQLQHSALAYNYLGIIYQDLGQWEAAQTAISQSLTLLKKSENINHSRLILAQVLNTQGSIQFHTGKVEAAWETWKLAEKHYRFGKDITGIVLSQINQAQALQSLGLYRRARTTLEQVNQDLAALPPSLLKARGLRSLGVILQVLGDLQPSQAALSESLAIAKRLNSTADIGATLFSLGNNARARGDVEAALKFYQQAKDIAPNPRTQLEAQLNQFSLLVEKKQTKAALALVSEIQTSLAKLPPSRARIYAQVNFADSLMNMDKPGLLGNREIAQMLATAVAQARELQDFRAESYALGQLGHLYEQTQQWLDALSLSKQALQKAQEIKAEDIAATWYWQIGRIMKAQGNTKDAIAAYDRAVKILQSLRQDLVAVNPDVQFSFRDGVEPVYRQFVQLLLQNIDTESEATKQQRLQRSREVIEGLQLAELENFFREACVSYQPKSIDNLDAKAAVIYPIILNQRLEVILSLPGKPLQHYGTDLQATETTKAFEQLRQYLNPVFLPGEVLPVAQKIYDWLVRPAQAELESQGIRTLVFVPDGFLRSLPMAVLHDGKQYLIERYSIALSPGLQLLESPNMSAQKIKALAVGLAEPRQGFSSLPNVAKEIADIASTVSAKVLLNQEFTRVNFQKQVESVKFSVVHLATHGQFSSNAENTFLLTWDGRINVKDLDRLLRGREEQKPIELLVLSACQTAKGDNRAALGLAGVAARSGARSTLATLWSVQDDSTAKLIAEFYRRLTQPGVTKAEALRQAQLSILNTPQYKHPYYWAPFVLVGNWLD
jgi:CHAT domain-containing protein